MTAFFVSDTHFGHKNALTFRTALDEPLRDFASVEEMDEHMIKCWNDVVSDTDTVYHLGDVVMHKRNMHILDRLKGKKKLIMGNHDIFGFKEYAKYFYDIVAYRVWPKEGLIASHIPVNTAQLEGRWLKNVHGHLHSNNVLDRFGKKDPRYVCVCVEQIDYRPVSLEEVLNWKY